MRVLRAVALAVALAGVGAAIHSGQYLMGSGVMDKSWAERSASDSDHIPPVVVNPLMLQLMATSSEGPAQLSHTDYRRLIVDMQKTLRECDKAIEQLQSERDRLSKHSRIQRKLIAHLRQQRSQLQEQVRSEQASRPAQQISAAGSASDSERKRQGRVKSLDIALLRINGGGGPDVDALPDDDINSADLDEFDLEELQPIVDFDAEPGLLEQLRARARQLTALASGQLSAYALFAGRKYSE